MPSLAKVTILWNKSVKIQRYMFSSVVVKSVSAIRKLLHYVKLINKIHCCKFFSIVATCFSAIREIM